MSFYQEIFDLLSEHGIPFSSFAEDEGLMLVRSRINIILVRVTCRSQSEAEVQTCKLKKVCCFLKETEGEWPLVITEDRWRRYGPQIEARILAHLGTFHQVYARNCEIRKIDKATAAAFLAENHSYSDAACRYRYGMFLKRYTGHQTNHSNKLEAGSLVAVATFSNARRWSKDIDGKEKTISSYEWVRYASLSGTRIVGGMGKMLQRFIEDVKPDDIMSYADLEWSDGSVYRSLGFECEGSRPGVLFSVNQDSWIRTPIKDGDLESCNDTRFLLNPGSLKYRLKLTDYE